MKNPPSVLVLGSLAFDYIMEFPYLFGETIVVERNKNLNAAFTVKNMNVLRGGTGGNISYSLSLLDANCILVSAAGKDFYERGYDRCFQDKVNLRVEIYDDQYTAAAYIISDVRNNQISAFHEGALLKLESIDLKSKIKPEDNIRIAINAPNPINAMMKYAYQLNDLEIPMIFDPGQQIKLFTKDHLKEIVPLTSTLIVNSSEFTLFKKTLETNINYLKEKIDNIIVTLGNTGSVLYQKGEKFSIPIAKANKVVDPTGAGDSFRAGFLKGIISDFSVREACQLGAVMGSFCVEAPGGQGHYCTIPDVKARYEKYFGPIPKPL
ncbi:MAG: carbohydrate kinase family protein [Candidatus Helarchaeota archaeon]|nr:carbohydrate kinase family protein [Candidatus Helarchaeota archaeon]